MNEDGEIIEGVRAAREDFATAHNYDIKAMVETLRALDAADTTRRIIRRPLRSAAVPAGSAVPTVLDSPATAPAH